MPKKFANLYSSSNVHRSSPGAHCKLCAEVFYYFDSFLIFLLLPVNGVTPLRSAHGVIDFKLKPSLDQV